MKLNFFKLIIFVLIGFFILLFYVWLQISSERLGYDLEKLRLRLKEEKNLNTQLKITVDSLSSPERLGEIANEMNLQPPTKSQIIEIE
jgi:cell division protein FtsL